MNWKDIVSILVGMALNSNAKTAPLAPHVVAGIQIAESFPGKSGKEKLAIASKLAAEGFSAIDALMPGVVAIPTKPTLEKTISAVVDAANVIQANAIVWGS